MTSKVMGVLTRLIGLSSDPASGLNNGEMWYNSSTGQLKQVVGGNVLEVSGMHPGVFTRYTAGRWYSLQEGNATTTTIATNRFYCVPFAVGRWTTLNGISVEIATAVTTGTLRAGLYVDDGNGSPGTRYADFGTSGWSAAATSAGVKTQTVSQLMAPNMYWITVGVQSATGSGQWRSCQGLHPMIGDPNNGTDLLNATRNTLCGDSISGALPTTFTVTDAVAGPAFALSFS